MTMTMVRVRHALSTQEPKCATRSRRWRNCGNLGEVKLCEEVAGIESRKAGGRAALKRVDVDEPEIALTWTSASRRPVRTAV
jgi:hypothetical protein